MRRAGTDLVTLSGCDANMEEGLSACANNRMPIRWKWSSWRPRLSSQNEVALRRQQANCEKSQDSELQPTCIGACAEVNAIGIGAVKWPCSSGGPAVCCPLVRPRSVAPCTHVSFDISQLLSLAHTIASVHPIRSLRIAAAAADPAGTLVLLHRHACEDMAAKRPGPLAAASG